jgi:hypothetical protein
MLWMSWMGASIALACGGTVCDGGGTVGSSTTTATSGPIVQSGESIVFVQGEDDDWTALVQIQTQGAAEAFGWVIPVPNPVDPDDVTVADDGLMDDLEQATAPQFQTDAGSFGSGSSASSCGCGAPSVSDLVQQGAARLLDAADLHGVAVVGPYEVASVGPDQVDALDAWLTAGGYTLPSGTWDLLDGYVADGFSFVVVRLLPLQGNGQGTVDTLVIPCGQASPTIPLKLTAIAATSDMAITTYVASNQRYEPPADWAEVPFDPSVVDPADPANDYVAQLQAAIDQAGGRGFRTEFAGPVSSLSLSRSTRDALGGAPYLTRFRTWASPEAMRSDPAFAPSAVQSDLSNVVDLRTSTTRAAAVLAPILLAALGARGRRRGASRSPVCSASERRSP